mmetsp:Transcript_16117/g.44651  ORF Transcript_16117/g.44651 Transcript_16117/m.44651 type:complete len:207 (-) Transcript_16117:460-1080(-)
MKFQVTTALALLLAAADTTSAFSVTPASTTSSNGMLHISTDIAMTRMSMSANDVADNEAETPSKQQITDGLSIPLSYDEMVRQAATTMKDAYQAGVTRQIIRVLLPRSPDNDQLLQYIENDADVDMASSVLVPPDETWQGGIMQLYRVASLTARDMLREYSRNMSRAVRDATRYNCMMPPCQVSSGGTSTELAMSTSASFSMYCSS